MKSVFKEWEELKDEWGNVYDYIIKNLDGNVVAKIVVIDFTVHYKFSAEIYSENDDYQALLYKKTMDNCRDAKKWAEEKLLEIGYRFIDNKVKVLE